MVKAEKRVLQIEAKLKDFLSRDLNKVEKALTRVGVYGTRAFKGLVSATFNLKTALTGLLAGYTALQGVQAIRRFGEEAEAMLNLARATGDLVENLSELEGALRMVGFEGAAFADTLKGLAQAQSRAIQGNAETVRAFDDLGISVEELRTLGPSQLFEEMARGLELFGTEQEKALALSRVLPEQFQKLLPLLGSGITRFQEAVKEARAVGATITEEQAKIADRLNDAFRKVELAVGSVARELLEAFGPKATAALEKLARAIAANKEQIAAIAAAIGRGIVAAVNLAIDAIVGLIGVIESIPGVSLVDTAQLEQEAALIKRKLAEIDEARSNRPLGREPIALPGVVGGGSVASEALLAQRREFEFRRDVARRREQILEELVPQEAELRRALATLETQMSKGLAGALQGVREQLASELSAATAEIRASVSSQPVDPDTAAAAVGLPPVGSWEEYAERFGKAMQSIQTTGSVFRDTQRQGAPAEPVLAPDNRAQRLALLQQVGSLGADLDEVQDALRAIEQEQIALTLEQAARDGIINAQELEAALGFVNAQFERMRSTTGGGDFFKGFNREAKNALRAWTDFTAAGKESAATLIDNGLNGLTNAFASIIDGTKSAKEAFKDFAKAMLADLAKIIARLFVMQALNAFLGLEDGGIVPAMEKGGVIRKFASGGVNRNGGVAHRPTVLFGEGRTAEAFVPLPDNRSIPVSFVGGGGAGGSNVNINITAMDGRDVQRVLFEQQGTLRTIFTNQLETKHGMRQVVRRAAG